MNRSLPQQTSSPRRNFTHARVSPAHRPVESALVRVCADCEQEYGPVPVPPGQAKTHGFCRRHALKCLRTGGLSEQAIRDFERRWRTVEMAPDRALAARPHSFHFPLTASETTLDTQLSRIDGRLE